MTASLRDHISGRRHQLADVLPDWSAQSWHEATLSDGWRVREVVAHVTMPFRSPTFPSHRQQRPDIIAGMSKTPPAPQVWPTLRANDARALIRFLVDVVGFEETIVHADCDVGRDIH